MEGGEEKKTEFGNFPFCHPTSTLMLHWDRNSPALGQHGKNNNHLFLSFLPLRAPAPAARAGFEAPLPSPPLIPILGAPLPSPPLPSSPRASRGLRRPPAAASGTAHNFIFQQSFKNLRKIIWFFTLNKDFVLYFLV